MFLDWIRKGKNKKTEVADAPKVDDPKPERESKTWKCSCGRKNNDYVSTCTCGTNKREMVFSATQQLNKAYIANSVEEKNDKIQWTIREVRQTTKISITSKGENTIRHYMDCDVLEDQVFEAVIAAGAQIIGIGMTEVHDWDDRDWYSAGFNSYEAYLQDAEHNRHICDWTADAKYGGVSITISKPYNMVRDGLVFRYAGTDDTHLEEFFEMFDQHCCKKKTVIDRRDATQKQSCTGNNSKQKKTIEPKVASRTPVEERQDADPLNCKVSGDSPKRRENDAVNKQRKGFILHTAKTDEELALIQSELSALIKRECGKQIFPYMYDEDIVGDLGSFDYESVFYFFSLNGFEFTLSFGLVDKIITLTHEGRADDPFGNEFADRLKQYIHNVIAQEEVEKASEKEASDVSTEKNCNIDLPRTRIIEETVPNICVQFDGTLVKVLKKEYEEFGVGFGKRYKKDCIMLRGENYYYQTIEKQVSAEGNGRPITYYSEYVFELNTSDISNVSMDNVLDLCKKEPIFNKTTSEYGVCF